MILFVLVVDLGVEDGLVDGEGDPWDGGDFVLGGFFFVLLELHHVHGLGLIDHA